MEEELEKTTLNFQILSAVIFGLMLGLFSFGLFWTGLWVLAFEYCVFARKSLKGEPYFSGERLLVNVVFFFAWSFSRYIYLKETGFEGSVEYVNDYWWEFL